MAKIGRIVRPVFSFFDNYSMQILFIVFTRQSSSFISNIHAFNFASPSAILYLSGSDVSNLLKETSISIPITEFFGPVIPISVIYAVPFFKIFSSAV